ncbi:hypothetical protein P154DRAFT_436510, partial [Amniculicola lignicola CBS 123094]
KVIINYRDFYNLSIFPTILFNRIYIIETFVYTNNPNKVLKNFYYLLKPSGILILYKVDFSYNLDKL